MVWDDARWVNFDWFDGHVRSGDYKVECTAVKRRQTINKKDRIGNAMILDMDAEMKSPPERTNFWKFHGGTCVMTPVVHTPSDRRERWTGWIQLANSSDDGVSRGSCLPDGGTSARWNDARSGSRGVMQWRLWRLKPALKILVNIFY